LKEVRIGCCSDFLTKKLIMMINHLEINVINLEMRNSILDDIANTPLLKLSKPGEIGIFGNFEANLYAKVESRNPSGSIKDRIAKFMIEQAEKRGDLKPGFTIVEATSGNTGIAFSFVSAIKGYKMVVVMPEDMTVERQQIMRAYGAEVVLTPQDVYVEGSVEKAKELAKQPGWWMPAQFDNFDNVIAHRETTGKEILQQIPGGKVDAFVASVGTGGTLMGVGQALRAVNPNVKIYAAQPEGSTELTGGEPGEHRIEGIADGFIPGIVDTSKIDSVFNVIDADAIRVSRILASKYGLFVGPSSGCNVAVALKVARRLKKGQNVVTVLPDSADRYLSTGLFEDVEPEDVDVPEGCAP
jgi:cysteine synthase A